MFKTFLQKATLVLASILVALVISEVGIRVTGLWIKDSYKNRDYFAQSDIPGVPYRLKPNVHAKWAKTNIITNSEGIRARRDYGSKKNGVFRILSIGDSITFGMGVDQDETFPMQLELLLNRYSNSTLEYEVINGGISGFNASDEAHFMAYLVEKYRPDMIIWMLIPNDYDDSLGVNENGQITHSIPSYAATSSWLEQTWGLSGPAIDPDNFLASMGQRHQCWALGTPIPQMGGFSAVDAYLNQRSYLYSLISTRLKGAIKARRFDGYSLSRKPNVLDRNIPFRLRDGSVDILPEISSIFVSPFAKKRFYNAIEKGVRSAEKDLIPLLLLSFNLHLDMARIPHYDNIRIHDIGQYLGMPVSRYRKRYNLGWDPHFSLKGNERLAYGIMCALIYSGLFNSEKDPKSVYLDRAAFWKQYERELAAYIDSLSTYIDFQHFKNIHQIVGGIYPPRLFPIKGNARLSVILKNKSGTGLRFFGKNGNPPQPVTAWLSDGHQNVKMNLTIPSGVFDLNIKIPDSTEFKGSVLDVHLYCDAKNCKEMKVNYLGFPNNGDAADVQAGN